MRNPRDRHNGLINYLANSITKAQFKKLKQMSRVNYFQPKELEDCDTHNFLNALEDKGHIGVGRYEVLKDLLKECGVARLVQDVEGAEDDIEEMERTGTREEAWLAHGDAWDHSLVIYPTFFIARIGRLESQLASRYRDDLHNFSIIELHVKPAPPVWLRQYSTSQPTTSTHMTSDDRVVTWKATESKHAELSKTFICGQWALSSDEPGHREWGGYKEVIDIETVEEMFGNHAREVRQTALEILASIPDIPKETLFILNVTQRPDLKTKWKRLLDGELFPDAKVLLFEGGDDQGTARGGKKRKLNGEVTGAQMFISNLCTVS